MTQEEKDILDHEISPIVKELLRLANMEDKHGIDPVTKLEQSASVTVGEVKNGLNMTATQATVEKQAEQSSAKVEEKVKNPLDEQQEILEKLAKSHGVTVDYLLSVAKEEGVHPTSVTSQQIAQEQAEDQKEIQEAIAAVTGAMVGTGAAVNNAQSGGLPVQALFNLFSGNKEIT